MRHTYWFRIAIALDQLLNTVLCGCPDETISSRCGKLQINSKLCKVLCFLLDKLDPGHCTKSIEKNEGGPNCG
jgi:hypothetical protein